MEDEATILALPRFGVPRDFEEKMADMDRENLLQSARATSAYFSSLVELIPAKYYLNEDLENNDTTIEGSGKAAREAKKHLAKKAKLKKLDPKKFKSIAEHQKDKEANELEIEDELEAGGDSIRPIKVGDAPSLALDELKQKLHDKIELLRGKRKLKEEGKTEDAPKKRKLEKKEKKKKQNKEAKNSELIKNNVKNEKKVTEVLNDRGEVVFSKFDFAEGGAKKKNKVKKNDVQALLKKAEKKKSNLEKLEEESKEKAEELKSKMKWDKALKHAEGFKVKDDPKLLLKTIKRKNKMKEAGKKKWEERVNTQKKMQEDKQKLRKQHIKERREKKGTKGAKGPKGTKNKSFKKHKPGF